jgi:F0F1-type ATP synthase assembly protein I
MDDEKKDDGANKNKPGKNWAEFNRSFGLVFNIGYYISASILISLFIGFQADKFFGTAPLFTLVMLFLGVIAGMLEIFKITKLK